MFLRHDQVSLLPTQHSAVQLVDVVTYHSPPANLLATVSHEPPDVLDKELGEVLITAHELEVSIHRGACLLNGHEASGSSRSLVPWTSPTPLTPSSTVSPLHAGWKAIYRGTTQVSSCLAEDPTISIVGGHVLVCWCECDRQSTGGVGPGGRRRTGAGLDQLDHTSIIALTDTDLLASINVKTGLLARLQAFLDAELVEAEPVSATEIRDRPPLSEGDSSTGTTTWWTVAPHRRQRATRAWLTGFTRHGATFR